MTKQELQFLLKKYHVQPRKEQGQHFLLDESVIEKIIASAALSKDDVVLEIGPGFGVLTQQLCAHAGRVIAVEQDRNIFPVLKNLAAVYKNLVVISDDIRSVDRATLGLEDRRYHLVANLPYSIAAWVIREFCEVSPRPLRITVMVQKEVAERLVAIPGTMNILGVITQMFADVQLVCDVSPTSFYPIPDVTSAIVSLTVRATPQSVDPARFIHLVKIGFAAKRKQLQNNLRAGFGFSAKEITALCMRANIDPMVRAEDLSPADWERLRAAIL